MKEFLLQSWDFVVCLFGRRQWSDRQTFPMRPQVFETVAAEGPDFPITRAAPARSPLLDSENRHSKKPRYIMLSERDIAVLYSCLLGAFGTHLLTIVQPVAPVVDRSKQVKTSQTRSKQVMNRVFYLGLGRIESARLTNSRVSMARTRRQRLLPVFLRCHLEKAELLSGYLATLRTSS